MASCIEIKEAFYSPFPRLRGDKLFKITSPETDRYNCIAWAMGFDDRWVDCCPHIEGHWWPPIGVCDLAPNSLLKAFEYMKFTKCEGCASEDGYEKVALYMIDTNFETGEKGPIWTHASRVLSEFECHSKRGASFDIHHRNGDVFEGSSYGSIYAYMKRRISDKEIVDRIKQEPECEIEIAW